MNYLIPFLFGIAASLGAFITELSIFSLIAPIDTSRFANMDSTNHILALGGPIFVLLSVCIEELFKYLLLTNIRPTRIFSWYFPFTIVSFGIGFSMLEGLLILQNVMPRTPLLSFHLLGIFLVHITTVGVINYGINQPYTRKLISVQIIIAILIHFAYNLLILYQNNLA